MKVIKKIFFITFLILIDFFYIVLVFKNIEFVDYEFLIFYIVSVLYFLVYIGCRAE